jgi:hypothetical protein
MLKLARLHSCKSVQAFKEIICDSISEFESYMPSQAVLSLLAMSGVSHRAALTRIVSGGPIWPSRGELSPHLKYMADARMLEFESSQPSQSVWSLWAVSGLQKYTRHSRELVRRYVVSEG